jgi:hypothetical protein
MMERTVTSPSNRDFGFGSKKDPIVEEIRAAREAIAKEFDFNIHEIVKNTHRRQARSGHKIQKITSRSFWRTLPHPPRRK